MKLNNLTNLPVDSGGSQLYLHNITMTTESQNYKTIIFIQLYTTTETSIDTKEKLFAEYTKLNYYKTIFSGLNDFIGNNKTTLNISGFSNDSTKKGTYYFRLGFNANGNTIYVLKSDELSSEYANYGIDELSTVYLWDTVTQIL